MSAWLEAYERLPEDAQARVKGWLHLQKFIADTLRVPWETWVDQYLGYAMAHPFDYSFMHATFPAFLGIDSESPAFTREIDPATAVTARVPLRAKNNLGRLSPALQDAIAAMLESDTAPSMELPPADVLHLQKIFPKEKVLAKLKKKDLRALTIERDADDILISLAAGDEILRMNALEFGAVMGKALV